MDEGLAARTNRSVQQQASRRNVMNPIHVNPIRMLRYITHHSETWHALAEKKPSVMQMLWLYVVPMSLIPPLMLNVVVRHYPKVFMDVMPGDRLHIVGIILFLSLVVGVIVMAWISQMLADMVEIRPSYRDAFLVTAVATTPFWAVSLFYLVPNMTVNIVMHFVAAAASIALVYQGVKRIFRLKRKGAAAMLTTAIGCTAAVGFGVLLVGILMLWGVIQDLQFAVKA
jgi:hypothetical protein